MKNKYVFDIICRGGFEVVNLKILAETQEKAKAKVQQMYRHCQFTREELLSNEPINYNFEDVMSIITK